MLRRNETKAERFKRLAEYRTGLVLDGLRKLSNLANSRRYTYTGEEVKKIFGTINVRVTAARYLFRDELKFVPSEKDDFKL